MYTYDVVQSVKVLLLLPLRLVQETVPEVGREVRRRGERYVSFNTLLFI